MTFLKNFFSSLLEWTIVLGEARSKAYRKGYWY